MTNIFLKEYQNEFLMGILYIEFHSKLEHLLDITDSFPLLNCNKYYWDMLHTILYLHSNSLEMSMQYMLRLNNKAFLEDIYTLE